MSTETTVTCDINGCKDKASPVELTLLNVEIVPTGNSDYSAYEEKSLKNTTVDLCETHRELYETRMPLVKDRGGLRMKTPMNTTNPPEVTSE